MKKQSVDQLFFQLLWKYNNYKKLRVLIPSAFYSLKETVEFKSV